MSTSTCGNCKYWQPPRDDRTGEELPYWREFNGTARALAGTCRRTAPTTGAWPFVTMIDWCGEFVSKNVTGGKP